MPCRYTQLPTPQSPPPPPPPATGEQAGAQGSRLHVKTPIYCKTCIKPRPSTAEEQLEMRARVVGAGEGGESSCGAIGDALVARGSVSSPGGGELRLIAGCGWLGVGVHPYLNSCIFSSQKAMSRRRIAWGGWGGAWGEGDIERLGGGEGGRGRTLEKTRPSMTRGWICRRSSMWGTASSLASMPLLFTL